MNVGVAAALEEHGIEPGRAVAATMAAAESRERKGKLRVCEKSWFGELEGHVCTAAVSSSQVTSHQCVGVSVGV